MKNISSEKIINALGGSTKLAKRLGLTTQAVQAWKKRGIPPKYLLAHPKLIARGRKIVRQAEEKALDTEIKQE